MAHSANLNGVSKTLSGIAPKLPSPRGFPQKRERILGSLSKPKTQSSKEQNVQTTRRLALGITSIALVGTTFNDVSLAEGNGYWIDGRIPEPVVENKIVNEKTGTRSFIKKGLFIADIGNRSRPYRIRKYAFDLLALEDLIHPDKLNYVQKYLRLKSTSMYYDFDRVITAAEADNKQPLIDLANRLFDSVETLEDATKLRNFDLTVTSYKDTKAILQEVMVKMASIYKGV